MTSKHTPGPWTVMEFPDEKFVEIRAHQGYAIVGHVFLNNGARDATARLIAAAPECLEVAEFVYQALLRHPVDAWRIRADGQQSLCMLRSFIASATGRSEQEVQEFYEAAVAGEAACAT